MASVTIKYNYPPLTQSIEFSAWRKKTTGSLLKDKASATIRLAMVNTAQAATPAVLAANGTVVTLAATATYTNHYSIVAASSESSNGSAPSWRFASQNKSPKTASGKQQEG
ncbi:hypothetical protein DFJ73DRAFT_760683 [Zopfochytrium polystomum]|nr:hypothetical protein DFJ73DRAFT_760683 [Zopfochytrium polystomum]